MPIITMQGLGFPGGTSGKEPACQCERHKRCVFAPLWGEGRSPGGGQGSPLQYSCLENPTYRGAWWAIVHGVTESDTTESTKYRCTMQRISCCLHYLFYYKTLENCLQTHFVLSSLPLDYDTATLIGNGLQGTISGCQGMKETHDIPSPEFKTNFFKVFEYYVSIVFSCIPFRHISEKCFIISQLGEPVRALDSNNFKKINLQL